MRFDRWTILSLMILPAWALAAEPAKGPAPAPSQTVVQMRGSRYQFLLNGSPFFIQGAAATNRIGELAAAGANCTLAPDLETAGGVLDQARAAGIMAAVTIRLEPTNGLNYANTQEVETVLAALRPSIQRLKTHPRLLCWVIASDVSGAHRENAAAYRAVNRLAELLHGEDPAHAVISDVGVLGMQDPKAQLSAQLCPEVDILGWTLDGTVTNLAEALNHTGLHKPFVILGAGAPDPAAAAHAAWGAPIEPLPSGKLAWCLNLFTNLMRASSGQCLGAIVFCWDPSGRITPTWYSLHLADGSRAELADALAFAWSGRYPLNRCPVITALTSAISARLVSPGVVETAEVSAADPDKDPLTYNWVLRKEVGDSGAAGPQVVEYRDIPGAVREPGQPRTSFTTPAEPGPYRLFVYVRDGKGHTTGANIPFLVEAVRAAVTTSPPTSAGQPTGTGEVTVVTGKPRRVTVVKTAVGGGWQLVVDGQPFFVKGAGGHNYLDELKAAGGNAIRTWSTDQASSILDEAQKHGLMVCLGLWMKQERHRFDYSNPEAVDSQLQKLRASVRRYRNHPALLMWCCGIEVEWGAGTNVAVYKAINDVARMIHEEDPFHPTTTAFADLGSNGVKVALAARYCPDLDIVGVNSYGGLTTLARRLGSLGWSRPYMIMEFGPKGQWESPKTAWGSEVEQMPADKAAFYLESYRKSISSQENWCLGSFVFSWDSKFETTPTWYSMHLLDGTRLNTADTMCHEWSNHDPTNRCPEIRWLGSSLDRAKVGPNKTFSLDVDAVDPDGDTLRYQWVLMSEIRNKGLDGTTSSELKPIAGRITDETQRKAKILTPSAAGAYRVFIYAYDGHGNASSANMPFYVEPPVAKSTNSVSRR